MLSGLDQSQSSHCERLSLLLYGARSVRGRIQGSYRTIPYCNRIIRSSCAKKTTSSTPALAQSSTNSCLLPYYKYRTWFARCIFEYVCLPSLILATYLYSPLPQENTHKRILPSHSQFLSSSQQFIYYKVVPISSLDRVLCWDFLKPITSSWVLDIHSYFSAR